MKFNLYISAALIASCASLVACNDDYETVDNRVIDESALTPSTVLIDGKNNESTQRFNVTIVKPESVDVEIVYGVEPSLLEAYNTIYGESAILLPEENYNIVEPVAKVKSGGVSSSDVVVEITDLNNLDRNNVYVLPLTVKNSTVPVLESQKNRYIVVRGAALINVVCDINEKYCMWNILGWPNYQQPAEMQYLNNMSAMTVQMLVNIDEFGGSEAGIQSLIGIEGSFLYRLGDSEPIDQIQFVTPGGNVSDPSWSFKAKEWTRLTMTYDSNSGDACVYINGAKKVVKNTGYHGTVNWGNSNFYIGRSYSNNRWLKGCVSEVRVWNRVLSDAELAVNNQAYSVSPDSEGLVTYWKFDEGEGTLIHDYANGLDLMVSAEPKWVPVVLPE